MHGLEETQCREVEEWRDDPIAYADQGHHREHSVEIHLHRDPHDERQDGNKGEAGDDRRHEACDGRTKGKFPDPDRRYAVCEETCHIGAEEFRSKVAIRESRLTGEDFHQRCDHADAKALLVCRLRQKDRYHIGRDHPVRREACHRWRDQVQQHPDRQHQCGNRQPAEAPAPRLDKDKLRYIFHLFHFISPFTGSYSSNKKSLRPSAFQQRDERITFRGTTLLDTRSSSSSVTAISGSSYPFRLRLRLPGPFT